MKLLNQFQSSLESKEVYYTSNYTLLCIVMCVLCSFSGKYEHVLPITTARVPIVKFFMAIWWVIIDVQRIIITAVCVIMEYIVWHIHNRV